jgi:hypothetical protein
VLIIFIFCTFPVFLLVMPPKVVFSLGRFSISSPLFFSLLASIYLIYSTSKRNRLLIPNLRLFLSIISVWTAFVASGELLKITFDLVPTLRIIFLEVFMLLVIGLFIASEIKKVTTTVKRKSIGERAIVTLLIGLNFSILFGYFTMGFTSQVILSRSSYFDKYLNATQIKFLDPVEIKMNIDSTVLALKTALEQTQKISQVSLKNKKLSTMQSARNGSLVVTFRFEEVMQDNESAKIINNKDQLSTKCTQDDKNIADKFDKLLSSESKFRQCFIKDPTLSEWISPTMILFNAIVVLFISVFINFIFEGKSISESS